MLHCKASSRSSRLTGSLWLIVTVVAPMSAPAGETAAGVGKAIPPGQEELLSEMLGRGARLPGNCRFAGGGVEGAIVVARYDCGGETTVIELRAADDAPPAALRTRQFAIVVRSRSAPAELPEALAVRIRAREAAFEWRPVSVLQRHVFELRLDTLALAGCAGVMLLVALAAQYVVASRPGARREIPQAEDAAARGDDDSTRLALIVLIGVFLLTRMVFLTRLPVYVDESVHINWARELFGPSFAAEFSVGRWLPIRMMALFLLLPVDPLFAARLGSVSMGLAVLVGCVLINRELFSSTSGLLTGIAYTVVPYAVLYDRMALVDVYVVAFGTWAVYASIVAARRRSAGCFFAFGLCIYGAILSKPTGGLFLLIPILVSVVLLVRGERSAYLRSASPTLIGGMALLALLVWAGYGAGLLASQVAFEGSAQLTAVLVPNLDTSMQWFEMLFTPPVALLTIVAIAGASMAGIAGARAEAFLVSLLAVAVLPVTLVSRTWYPSYLLFAVVPITLLLGRIIAQSATACSRVALRFGPRLEIPARQGCYVVGVLLLVFSTAPLHLALLTRPQDAALPEVERTRYISGGLSGYGLPELAAFLREQARAGPLNVVRFDLVQPPREGLDVYLSADDSIHLHTVDHRDERAAAQLARLTATRRTLFVSNPDHEKSVGVSVGASVASGARIWSYERPGAQTQLDVWEITAGD
jgi:hypothetical protein